MSGGWQGSDRRQRLPDNWLLLVSAVMRRCGRRCEAFLPDTGARCPRPATDVDHKIPGDDHRLSNLQGLCSHHHAKKSSREGNAARRGEPKARPAESHPGWRG